MSETLKDLRYGLRGLIRNPVLATVAILTLGLGIGATTSIFTVVDAVLLRPLRFRAPDRLVRVYTTDLKQGEERDNTSPANYLDWKSQASCFDELAGFETSSYNVTAGEYPSRVRGASVTPEFFQLLGVDAARGRVFSPQIDEPGSPLAVVVSDTFWRVQLGADPEAVGDMVTLNSEPYTVVGVMPPGFEYPPEARLWTAARFRVPDPPVNVGEDPAANRGAQYIDVLGRLRQTATITQAQAEMNAIAERLEAEHPDTNTEEGVALVPLRSSMVSEARPLLLLLLAAVGFVLLIACANVANLLLARASQREREVAIRMAMGAGRLRLVRQLLTESLLLATLGGALGLGLAAWGSEALLALAPETIPRAAEVSIDLRILLFTSCVVLGTGLLFGLAPVPLVFRQDIQQAIKRGQGAYTVAEGGRRLRGGLVVAEVAISLLLLVGTGLMIRTLLGLTGVDPGFDPSNTLVAHVALPPAEYKEDHQRRAFQQQVLERLRQHPEVDSAATVLTLPMHWNMRGRLRFTIDGRSTPEGEGPAAGYQVVDPEYFRTLGIPLRGGRLFSAADNEDGPLVALVNEALVRRWWPDSDPIGQRISWGTDPETEERIWATIVGVVGDTHVDGLDVKPRAETYRPYRQDTFSYLSFVVRATTDATRLAPVMRQAVLAADPALPISGLKTMEQALSSSLDQRRFNMLLLGVFAVTALAMAAVGLYGVLSFSVTQRSHEIGIRRALGARPSDILRQILGEGLGLVLLGLALGCLCALALTRLIESLIHGVASTDPASFLVSALVLLTAALFASYLPAARAARVEPMTALRYE